MYPEHDDQFEETTIIRAEGDSEKGWSVEREDGWHIHVQPGPVTPKAGDVARFYGKGVGYAVRGLYINGEQVFYRTEAQQKEHHENEMYGADAADWIARWDAGKTVWTIEMGGMGPGYEQCIVIVTAELLRHMLAEKYDTQRWDVPALWEEDREAIRNASYENATIKALGGISGAQYGAACSVALRLYKSGPREVFADKKIKDRMIQASRTFPSIPAAVTA